MVMHGNMLCIEIWLVHFSCSKCSVMTKNIYGPNRNAEFILADSATRILQMKPPAILRMQYSISMVLSIQIFFCQLVMLHHYSDVIMSVMSSQITSIDNVCLAACSGTDQRKHQSSVSLAFVRWIHRWLVNSSHKGPVTWKMFPFDDVVMIS